MTTTYEALKLALEEAMAATDYHPNHPSMRKWSEALAAANAKEAKPAPQDKICEKWGVWYDGSRGGISGWVGSDCTSALFQSRERAQMFCPTSAYQPRLIFIYAAPVQVKEG